jgi:putative transposase
VTPPRRRYRTDLTDAQWQVLGSLIPQPKPGGRPVLHQRRELLNAMLYWRRAGCAWRLLAHDLPPGRPSTTTSAAGGWRGVGSGSCGYCALASGSARAGAHAERRSPGQPERADHRKGGAVRLRRRQASQRPQAPPAGRHPGAAAGRAREPANVSDQDGAAELLGRLDRRQLPRLRYGWADGGYRGAFLAWALARSKIAFQVVARADGGRRRRWLPPGVEPPMVPRFAVVPRRWVVERTFTWLGRFRRLSKDYEFLPVTSEAVIYLAMIQLLVRRLAGK